MQVKVKAVLS